MKKLLLILVLFAGVFSANQASASSYSVNEQAIDQLFENAIETSMISLNSTEVNSSASTVSTAFMPSKDKNAVAAILLDFFLGGLTVS